MPRPPRVDAPGVAFFVTTVTRMRRPILADEAVATRLLATIDAQRASHEFDLLAYVVMPDHLHLMIRPADRDLVEIMRRMKSLTWRRCRVELGLKGRLWQEGFFDEGIRSMRQLEAQIDYIHRNPMRAGLVDGPESWPWSSFGAIEGSGAPVGVDMDVV